MCENVSMVRFATGLDVEALLLQDYLELKALDVPFVIVPTCLGRRVENPAIRFTRKAKDGRYNEMPAEEYERLLALVNFLSDLFYNAEAISCADFLSRLRVVFYEMRGAGYDVVSPSDMVYKLYHHPELLPGYVVADDDPFDYDGLAGASFEEECTCECDGDAFDADLPFDPCAILAAIPPELRGMPVFVHVRCVMEPDAGEM